MWPLPKLHNELVTIIVDSSHLHLGVVKANAISNSPFVVQVYRAVSITSAIIDGYISNVSFIQEQIKTFVANYKLENAFFSLCIAGPKIEERLTRLKKATPAASDFTYLGLQKFIWDFSYLYTDEQGEHVFAVSGIKREQLFQYQLLALQLSINLVTVTTPLHTLLHVYRYMQGDTFRQAKLGVDLQAHQNRLESYFTQAMSSRIIQLNQSIESKIALPMAGLYCMEQNR